MLMEEGNRAHKKSSTLPFIALVTDIVKDYLTQRCPPVVPHIHP